MTIQSQFPASRPSLLLDFANAKRLDPRVTFTRASTARYYDGTTVAKAEENLFLYSQEFDNSYWTKASSTVTANSTTSPDGTTTADSVLEIATNGRHGIERLNTIASGIDHVFSIYIKPIDRTYITLALNPQANDSAWAAAIFDVATGTVASTNATSGLTVSASIVNAGSGWFRCALVGNVGATSSVYAFATSATDGTTYSAGFRGTQTITGDIAKGFYAWGAQLEQRSAVTAYTATTTAPITNYIPVLQTAASGQARFDHNPVTGESLGLLIEESRTNLFTYSEQFDNSAWTTFAVGSVATANQVIAPDGTLTSDLLREDTSNGNHYNAQAPTVTNVAHTFSVYYKLASGTRKIALYHAGNNVGRQFDASGVDSAGAFAAPTSYGVQAVGNGWYRAWITTTPAAGASAWRLWLATSANALSYAGDGYSGYFIWGAQIEAGAFPTSYIQTVAASATRQADAASMTGANFTSWYDQTEGTIYGEASGYIATTVANGNAAPTIASAWDAVYRSINIFRNDSVGASNGAVTFTVIPSSTEASLSVTTANFNSGLVVRACGAYKLNDIAFSANGTTAITDTSSLLPVPSSFQIGRLGSTNTGYWNGVIRKIAYYPLRLTNAQLQALTG